MGSEARGSRIAEGKIMNGSRTNPIQARGPLPRSSRAGFTLIEMLMSVTLVLIMMVMFAEVFQVAGNSVTKQRTLADNDQNARTFVTIMRGDLDKRTFRSMIPFYAGEPAANSATPFNSRRGYFYISNNGLGDGTDDVLQFTVMSTVSLRNSDESPYYGAAVQLPFPAPGAWTTNPAQGVYNFLQNPNQPDRDDGQIISNGAASSRAAEISYFMRGDRLYRRVMLIRDPIPAAGVDPTNPSQPTTAANVDYFNPASGLYSGNFWAQFDFSAFRTPTILNTAAGTPICARFTGLDFLRNDLPIALVGTPYSYSLGQTWNRFGHNHEILASNAANGLPREFSANAAPNFFLGRFTHEETSNSAFQYPQVMPPGGNPMDAAATSFADTSPPDGVIDSLAGGPRAGVDLLLSNVHEFRVEVWDDRLASFVGIGHSTGNGDFHTLRRLNASYGPLGGVNNVFDTWHPLFDRNFDGNPSNDPPPFRPLNYYPIGLPGPNAPVWATNTNYSTEDTNGNGRLDGGEDSNGNGVLDADVIFPNPLGEDVNGNNVLDMGEDLNGNGVLDFKEPFRPFGQSLVYRCLKSGTSSGSLRYEPSWTATPGRIMRGNPADVDANGDGDVVDPGDMDWNLNGVQDPAEPDWICEYNVRPLRAIRITVRYQHPTSQQMKQVTLVHSLRDTTSVP